MRPQTFESYAQAGFGRHLLPIIPPGSRVSASSRNPRGVTKSRGKIPGRHKADGWCGFAKWTEFTPTDDDLDFWDASADDWNTDHGVHR